MRLGKPPDGDRTRTPLQQMRLTCNLDEPLNILFFPPVGPGEEVVHLVLRVPFVIRVRPLRIFDVSSNLTHLTNSP